MSNLYSNEAAVVPQDKPSRLKNLASRAINYCKKNKGEVVLISGTAIGCIALVGGILKISNDQDAGIIRTLGTEASQTIPGFESVSVDGTMINYDQGSLHGATVELENGSECKIQFTTTEEGGWYSRNFAPDHATIVSFGTCPTVETAGN